jgi:ribosomal small subunit protein bTHX
MGKGDIKTRKGKRAAGSFGVRRPKKKRNVDTSQVVTKGEKKS